MGYLIKVPQGAPRHVRVSGIHLNNHDYGPEVVTTIKGTDPARAGARQPAGITELIT